MDFFSDLIDFVVENPIKTTLFVVGTVATGGVALGYAPVIATTIATTTGMTASTGTLISSLTGVAATNASLAALGVCSRNGKNRTLSPVPERWSSSPGLAQLQANL